MLRVSNFALVVALLGTVACGDNGTVLGSAANGGAGGSSGSTGTGGTALASGGNSSGGVAGSSTPSSGGSSAGMAGAAGSAAGAASGGSGGSGPCAGAVCGGGQLCCGPPECGFCIPEQSGAFCGFACSPTCTVVGDCKSVVQNVATRLAEAQACAPSLMPEPQCPAQILDACGCSISVVSQDAPATQCYLEAVAQLNSMPDCSTCVPSPCPSPTGQCAVDGSGSGTMHCR